MKTALKDKVLTCDNTQAKIFFDVLKTNDTSKLGVKNHQQQFSNLYDEFYKLRGDQSEKHKMQALGKVSALNQKITYLKFVETVYLKVPLTDKKRERIKSTLKKLGYSIGETAKEVKQQFNQWIGVLETELEFTMIENNLDKETKQIDYTFSDILIAFQNKLKYQISFKISISEFVAYEKACKR